MPKYIFAVHYLSDKFYDAYPAAEYPEILINNSAFIDSSSAVVDQDEYVELRSNIEKICKKALIYLEDYIAFINGKHVIDSEEFFRRYRYSALPCFHDILFHSSQTSEFLL